MRILICIFFFVGCIANAQVNEVERSKESPKVIGEAQVSEQETFFITDNFEQVLKSARRSKKSVIIHFGAEWCLPCKQMRRITYKNENVRSVINDLYIPFRVDVDFFAGMDIADKYRVKKYPTVITLDYKGNITSFTEGYVGPDQMITIIN